MGPNAPLDQCTEAARPHWDNIVFDGPALPLNGLTPPGSQDILFNANSVGGNGMSDGTAGVYALKAYASPY